MFEKLKKIFTVNQDRRPSSDEMEFVAKQAKEKAEATKRNEPWVSIMSLDIDYEHLNDGSFELDWNDAFITKLMKAGYEGKEEHDLVDQWFNNVCRNVVMETYQQEQADPTKRGSYSGNLNNGRKEYK